MAEVAERVARIEEQFETISQRFTSVDARLDRVDARLERVDARLDRVEDRLAEVNQSISCLEGCLDGGLSEVRMEMRDLRGEMNTQFRWLMGGIGGAILAALASMLST